MRRLLASLLAVSVLSTLSACAGMEGEADVTDEVDSELKACANMTAPVYGRVQPEIEDTLLTVNSSEAASAASKYGYTDDLGIVFRASRTAGTGLVPIYRLYSPSKRAHFWTPNAAERDNAKVKYGFTVDEGVAFHASRSGSTCAIPVFRFYSSKDVKFRWGMDSDRARLKAEGWTEQGVDYYASTPVDTEENPPAPPPPTPSPTDTKFTLVVMPDTQRETNGTSDRFANRMNWMVANRSSLDIRFALQVGDLVDWDTPDHIQFERASAGLRILDNAKIPYAIALGNHDTAAVCPGGSACPGAQTWVAVRDTATFNRYFPSSRFLAFRSAFEQNKIDNALHTFEAGGLKWLVINLELWPRATAIAWARESAAKYPNHNVIMVTHMHLNADSTVSVSNGGYGANSPKYVFDNFLKVAPNVRMVFSGHVGTAGYRVDTGNSGNKIYSFLQCYHDMATNPMRLLEIDTKAGTMSSRVYSPFTNTTKNDGSTFTVTGVNWVR